jgi:two-component sensor histidine kinase/PAS domain-containing protein
MSTSDISSEPPGLEQEDSLPKWLFPESWPRWLPYLLAPVLVATFLFLRLSIIETFGERPLLIIFVLPIIVSAYLGGLGPGLLATFAASAGMLYLLIPPPHRLADLLQWSFLIISGILISALNEALHRFRRQAERLATFSQLNPNPVLEIAANGTVTYANPRALAVLENLGPDYRLVDFLPADWEEIKQEHRQNGQRHFYRQVQIKDTIFAETIAFADHFNGCRIYTTDITERQRAEAALRQSDARLQLALAAAKAGAWEWDLRTGENHWSEELWSVLGSPSHSRQPSYEAWLQTVHPNDHAGAAEAVRTAVSRGAEYEIEWRVAQLDGSIRWLFSRGKPQLDDQGQVIRYVGITMDITARKQAEAALRESEERLRWALQGSGGGVWDWDLLAGEAWWSLEMYALWGISPGTKMHLENSLAVVQEQDRALLQQNIEAAIASRTDFHCEFRVLHPECGQRWMESYGRLRFDQSDRPTRLIGITLDVTARKEAEAALSQSLAEKTALLKEVHHRVKNNLQIVASLLNLQVNRAKNREVIEILEETRSRVHSMALLHEVLYRSVNLARINFATYVSELCHYLQNAFGTISSRVSFVKQVAPVGLPLESSLPCGLIINELVSNALKHAFPDNRQGQITVALVPTPPDHLSLTVEDDGIGSSSGLALDSTSTLGLRLVSRLAAQMQGQLTVTQPENRGLAFTLIFPTPPGTLAKD